MTGPGVQRSRRSGGAGRLEASLGVPEAAVERRGPECVEVRLTRELRVDSLQSPGRAEEERLCFTTALLGEGDHSTEPLHMRHLRGVELGVAWHVEKREGSIRRASGELGIGS